MDVILAAITAAFMGYQTTAPEFRHNSLYTFNIDPATSEIVIMNTQTGELVRCSKDLICPKSIDSLQKNP